jgi:energy-coupling factor transporter transmembrane protein EcfT
MSGGAAFDFFVQGRSRLHRLDPRVKLALVGCGSAVLLLWHNLALLLLALALLHALLRGARYPWERIGAMWRALAPLLILVVLIWPVFYQHGRTLFEVGPLRVTLGALLAGLANATRLAAISFVVLVWVGTTDARELVRSFTRLGLPFRWGMALTIGLRFIPTFAGVYATVSDAQQARGLILRGRGLARARGMLPILVASFVTALRASEQLAMTLEARGFGASPRRTTLRDLTMRRADWLALALLVATTTLLAWLALARGVGRDVTRVW